MKYVSSISITGVLCCVVMAEQISYVYMQNIGVYIRVEVVLWFGYSGET